MPTKDNQLEGFLGCLKEANGYGNFKGTLAAIENGKCLLKDVVVEWQTGLDIWTGKVDSVWVQDAIPFVAEDIAAGDAVSFSGHIVQCKEAKDTLELELVDDGSVQKIESYEVPSEEQLEQQFLEQISCETCLYAEQCDHLFCMFE